MDTEDDKGPALPPDAESRDDSRSDATDTGVVKHHTVRLAPGVLPGSQSVSTDRRGSPGDAFQPGQIVSGRYKIIRFIAKGGMGEVYEAEDLEFSGAHEGTIERVALKTVRLDMADRDDSIQRFRREILHSRKVSHPNVSRIFESGRHRLDPETPDGPAAEILFFTMELLEGETLRERVKRLGRMTPAQALPLVAQMASGLATAHAAGVVHRDFKSSNVFLVSGPAGERAVVTDFGLARGEVEESSLASLTGTGDTLGTLAYMAPEQFGRSKGAQSPVDIYALGVVMYEMVTAEVPFPDMVKKLSEKAPSPRTHVPDLDPVWEKTILRCLERAPEDRFESATDVIRALGGEPVTIGRKTEKQMLMGAAVAVALALAGGYYLAQRSPVPPSADNAGAASPAPVAPPQPAAIRRSVAVMGFKPPLGDTDSGWISSALVELLSGGLASGGQLRVVAPLQVRRTSNDVSADLGNLDPEQLGKLRQILPAQVIVSGAYSFIGQGGDRVLRVEMRLDSPGATPPSETWTVSGTENEIADLAARAGETIREKLGAPKLLPAQQAEVAALLPPKAAERKAYTEALNRLGHGDARGARALLERVVAGDPKRPGAQAALALAWSLQGDQPKASAAMARAVAADGPLPSEQKLWLEAKGHEIDRDWKGAIASYESLRAAFPDDPEYLLSLVECQMQGGRTKDALAAIAEFRNLPKTVSDDPRIDLAEARAYARLGEHQQVQIAAARAAKKGVGLGSAQLTANGKLLEAVGLDGLGEAEKSAAALEEARRLFETAGDREGVARSLSQMGISLLRRTDSRGALQVFETALGIFRETGDRLSESRTLFNMGIALMAQGREAEAAARADEALKIAQQIGAKIEAASALNNLGSQLLENGDLSGAQKRYQQALALYTEIGEKRLTALTLTNLGEVLFARGDLKRSRDSHEEALGMNRQLGDAAGAAYDQYRIAEVLTQKGDLNEAEKRYRESIKEQTEEGTAAETQIRLASLLIDVGRPAEAEKEARAAEETLRVQGAADLALWAEVVIADAERAQGKLDAARADLDKALPRVEKTPDRRVKISAVLAQARLAVANAPKQPPAGLSLQLETERQLASTGGRVVDEFELRLAAAQLDIALGTPGAAGRLRKLVADSRAKGLEGIAKKAEATAGR